MANAIVDRILFGSDSNRDWHMSFAERVALMYVLNVAKPDISIEIGTFRGGSLRPISRASNRVYSLDVDANQHRNSREFTNVVYVTGDSRETLPSLIDGINSGSQELNFVLVDGSHEMEGVVSDLTQCLRYKPKANPTFIVMHDAANPAVRAGILAAPWADSSYVHAIDLDFVNGMIFDRADIRNQIWGGLGLAVLMPEKRSGDIMLTSYFDYSCHAFRNFVEGQ